MPTLRFAWCGRCRRRWSPDGLGSRCCAFRCDSDLGQLAAIRAGFGIGVCQYGVAGSVAPALVAILPREVRFELEVWLVMHEALRKTTRIKLMFDHLVAEMSGYVARSQGPTR
jgi:DNA-binding transcriptional LysR family regulator